MASTLWKGHLTFGLISIPVKLTKAARAEKVSFRNLYKGDHSRVRQSYVRQESATDFDSPDFDDEEDAPAFQPPTPAQVRSISDIRRHAGVAPAREQQPAQPDQQSAVREQQLPFREQPSQNQPFRPPGGRPDWKTPPPEPEMRPVDRSEIVKGFEYGKDQYVVLTKDELAALTEKTSREMEILEFVKIVEVDPIYFETSYYVHPDKAGERPYSLLLAALRKSAFVAVARLVMQKREHLVLIRPGRSGLVLHTMFFENEVRREDEYRTDVSNVVDKELDLAVRLIESLASPFDASKYKDTYREKLEALIAAKMEGRETVSAPEPAKPPAADILRALEQSLQMTARKPPARTEVAGPEAVSAATGAASKRTGTVKEKGPANAATKPARKRG